MFPLLTKTSPPIKTPTRGSMYGCRVIYSAIAPILSPIASTPAIAAATTIASASI